MSAHQCCDTCKHCGDWQIHEPYSKQMQPYELAVCKSEDLPDYWRKNGPLYVMHGTGTQCNLWEAKQ